MLFRNFSNGQLLEQITLDDVTYVVNDSIRSLPWKLAADTLTVLGHLCKKATAITDLQPKNSVPVIAWYCDDIPLPIGPDHFGSLPGAILKLDIANGGIVYTATGLSPSVDTLAGPPRTTSHVELTEAQRARLGIPEGLIRYSVGIEDVDDLLEDLGSALAKV